MIWRTTVALLAIIIIASYTYQATYAQEDTRLFPSWFNQNLRWFLDGQLDEKTLAEGFKYLADNDIVFLDPDRAMKVKQLQEENRMLKEKIGGDPGVQSLVPVPVKPTPGALPELPGCPDMYDPVCGRDGRTYPNKCSAEESGVGIVHDGECRDRPQTQCPDGYFWIDCAGICVQRDTDFVCPDGFSWSERADQCIPDRDEIYCTAVWDPVCGVDGKTYGNECEAKRDGVEVAYEGECRDRCRSNDQCRGDLVCRDGICQVPCNIQCVQYDPVCGTDGNTYGCGIPDAQCHGVEVAHAGECRVDVQPCTQEYMPVCGTDGVTYSNSCMAKNAGAEISYEGECRVDAVCSRVYAPVCGVDGQTYDNSCYAEAVNVEIAHEGECRRLSASPAQ